MSRALCLLNFISFYVVIDAHFPPSTIVSCFRRFSRFRLRFVLFRKTRIFRDFFFPSLSSPCCGTCAFLCGDRGRSLFNVPRGDLSLGALFPHTLSSSPAFSPAPPRLVPAFKRPPMRPPPFHIAPHLAHNTNLTLSQEIPHF